MNRLKYYIAISALACLSYMQAQAQAQNNGSAHYMDQQHKLSPRSLNAVRGFEAASANISAYPATISAYIKVSDDFDPDDIQQLGGKVIAMAGQYATIRIDASMIAKVAEIASVQYIQTSAKVNQNLDMATEEAGATKVNSGYNGFASYTGKGVVIGIVDAGFDYTHAAFKDKDGNCRIKRVWEQSTPEQGVFTAPEKYGYGIEIDSYEKLNTAQADITGNSHGTHVTAIAAGRDPFNAGALNGAAPDADIVLVSMGESSRDNVNISNAIAYIYDYAEMMGMPCVVNLSLGAHAGPHDGTSPFDLMADAMQKEGRLIVGSAGNHRADKFHIEKSFDGNSDKPLKSCIFFKAGPSTMFTGHEIDIWGEEGMDYEVALSIYDTSTKSESDFTTVYPSEQQTADIKLSTSCVGTINISHEINPNNNKRHVLITSNLTGLKKNKNVVITITPKSKGKVDIWADNVYAGLTSNDIEGYCNPDGESTIAEIGGTAKRILTVGAYTTRNEFSVENGGTGQLAETIGEISSFSSYGPTADGRVKPEITAPGCYIISALNKYDGTGMIPVAYTFNDDTRSYSYGYMQGTSMSAPLVTGIVATWLQANPNLTPEDIREIAIASARQDEHTGTIGNDGDNSWGYGKIDAFGGLVMAINKAGGNSISTAESFDGEVRIEGSQIMVRYAKACAQSRLRIFSADGKCVSDHLLGTAQPGDQRIISMQGNAKGIYVVRLDTNGNSYVIKALK